MTASVKIDPERKYVVYKVYGRDGHEASLHGFTTENQAWSSADWHDKWNSEWAPHTVYRVTVTTTHTAEPCERPS